MNAPAPRFQPQDPQFAARVRASFGRQKAMALSVAKADVHVADGSLVAAMQQTLMMLPGTPDTVE